MNHVNEWKNFFKKDEPKAEPKPKSKEIRIEGSKFWAQEITQSENTTWNIYHSWGFGMKPMTYAKTDGENFLMQIPYNYSSLLGTEVIGKRIKASSIEDLLKFLQEKKDEQTATKTEAESKIDIDLTK